MASAKWTSKPPITGADTAAGDLFLLADISAAAGSQDKTITRDELKAALGVTSGGSGMSQTITQTAHALVVGDVVRYSGTAYVKALADTAINAEVVGIVTKVTDANTFTLTMGGTITGLSGLTAGETYFLSGATAGALSLTEGTISKPLLVATSTTAGVFVNWRGLEGSTANNTDVSAKARRTTDLSIANATVTEVPFESAVFDTDAHWASGAPTRLTCKVGGKYVVNAVMVFDPSTAGRRVVRVRKNGTEILSRVDAHPVQVASQRTSINISTIINLAATDFIEFQVFQDSGAALNLYCSDAGGTFMIHGAMVRIR